MRRRESESGKQEIAGLIAASRVAAAVPPGAICRWQRIDIRERRKMCRMAARACECVDSFEGAMAREREQKKKERKKRDGGVGGEG